MITTITPPTATQLDEIMGIWLQGNLQAHDFVPASYWQGAFGAVRAALPKAELTVVSVHGHIVGFAGVQENYLAGLFIAEAYRDQGLGADLLASLQQRYAELTLSAYVENHGAVRFYQRLGFVIVDNRIDDATGQAEVTMRWQR